MNGIDGIVSGIPWLPILGMIFNIVMIILGLSHGGKAAVAVWGHFFGAFSVLYYMLYYPNQAEAERQGSLCERCGNPILPGFHCTITDSQRNRLAHVECPESMN